MLPIIALLLAAVSLQAQQILPLPPRQVLNPIFADQEPIPEQSASELKGLANDAAPSPQKEAASDISLSPSKPLFSKSSILYKEDEIKRLKALPVFDLQTNKAPLAQALTLLADTCQMSYIGLEKGLGDNVQISVNISRNPYETLQLLCDRYNVNMDYQDGIWRFNLYNDNDLIARIYHLRYNTEEEVTGNSGGGGGGTTGGSTSTSSSGTAGGAGASSNLSSSANSNFSVNKDVITKNIETFLAFSSEDPTILTAEDFDVDHMTKVTARGIERVLPKTGGSGGSEKGKVIYNSDNHSLYVLATRAQHQWIEKYLASVDKPQKQIMIETKVFETSLTPDTVMGVAWHTTGTLSQNFSLGSHQTSVGSGAPTPNTGGSSGGLTALLSGDGLHAALDFLTSDSHTTSSQYPRQVTISNRPVSMASTKQTPILQGSSSTSVGTGSTTNSAQETTVTTGIDISILPRIIDDNKILLDISVTSSEIDGYTSLPTGGTGSNGQPTSSQYPIVDERDYKTQAIVENGYTLAIGGLKGVTKSDTYQGVPVLSQVPLIGSLFRQRDVSSSDDNLMLFVTPQILKDYRGGVKENPEFIAPRDRDYAKRRAFQGTPDESYTDIMLSLAGMEYDLKTYAQQTKENMNLDELKIKVAESENELKLMEVRLKEIAIQQPEKDISEADQKIGRYMKELHELRTSILKDNSQLAPLF